MATYAEELAADRPRLQRALTGLIAEQEAAVRRLSEELGWRRAALDRAVLKLILITEQVGRSSAEAVAAQREAEDANSPVVELTQKLERQETILALYRSRLEKVNAGQALGAWEQQEAAAVDEQLAG